MSDTKPTVAELKAAFATIARAEAAIVEQAKAAGLDVRVHITPGGMKTPMTRIASNKGAKLFRGHNGRRSLSEAFASYDDEARIAAVIAEGAEPK